MAQPLPDTEATDWRTLDAALRPEDPQPEGWYVVALSDEVPPSEPFGTDFLGGRVVVYRKASGEPVVLTARCPHMGADLALGDIVEDQIRCTYHHFCFGTDGRCTKIPSEGPIPSAARVHSYPSLDGLHPPLSLNTPPRNDRPKVPPSVPSGPERSRAVPSGPERSPAGGGGM